MNLILKDATNLLSALIDGTLKFKDSNSARFVVNALCEALSNERELYELRGFIMADDVNEWLGDFALEQDWFSVLTYDFDDAEIASLLIQGSELSAHYTESDMESFVNEYLSEWCQKTKRFILEQAQTVSAKETA
ncbi:TPA: hypothetical protein ACGVBV_002943 [Vibrio vulnificus]